MVAQYPGHSFKLPIFYIIIIITITIIAILWIFMLILTYYAVGTHHLVVSNICVSSPILF